MSDIILLPLSELDTDIRPIDKAAGLEGLEPIDAAVGAPLVVSALTGKGRDFLKIGTNASSMNLVRASQMSARITDGAQTGYDITGDITLEAWVRFATLGTFQYFLCKSGTTHTGYRLKMNFNGDFAVDFSLTGAAHIGVVHTPSPAINTGEWNHYAATRASATGAVEMYINGQPVKSSTVTAGAMHNNSEDFSLGDDSTVASNFALDGDIDEARVWSVVRTPAEILASYDKEVDPTSAGLQGNYRLDDLTDETANGNDLTGTNSPTFTSAVPFTVGVVTDVALEADDVDSAALLQRDISVMSLLAWDIDAQDDEATDGAIISLRSSWSLLLKVVDAATRQARLQWSWLTSTAEADVGGGGDFIAPAADYLLVTATRRWISATEVRCRYYVGDVLLGKFISADGTIDGVAAEKVVVGARDDGAAGHELFYKGIIDQIRVADTELTAAEIRQIYRRMTIHQPNGYDTMRASTPTGSAYGTDPDNGIQRELQVEGGGLGDAFSLLETIREDYSPATAWSMLDDWERVTKLPPQASDSIETRRARVLGFMRTRHGHHLDGVRAQVAPALAVDADSVEIVEYTNVDTDDFATALAPFWSEHKPLGSISIASGEVVLVLDNAADGRWYNGDATYLRMPIDGDPLDSDPSVGVDATVKFNHNLAVSFSNGNHAGIFCHNAVNGGMFWFGVYKTGGVSNIGYRVFEGHTLGAFTSIVAAPASPFWLRIRHDGAKAYTTWYSTTGPDDTSNENVVTGIALPNNIGLILMLDIAANTAASQAEFDDWRLFTPLGLRVYNWYAYRDPLLPGVPDLAGARAVVAKTKPAETSASAVITKSLICDDPGSLCDDGPLGA